MSTLPPGHAEMVQTARSDVEKLALVRKILDIPPESILDDTDRIRRIRLVLDKPWDLENHVQDGN